MFEFNGNIGNEKDGTGPMQMKEVVQQLMYLAKEIGVVEEWMKAEKVEGSKMKFLREYRENCKLAEMQWTEIGRELMAVLLAKGLSWGDGSCG
ncbi:hypothetical protein CR194_13035 [Salipaludibacillus keqinensis]|uniref:Uncharacterized protein n=1 Tax=Salipaludibacillus keqinensis TaxID=2045207 RepID=A0A323TC09_9BACI|nr:hypothetical protein [Salipaludibacillus keqinensis]PYZ92589.1 hypothetical protein CR194_13035 [Salipaludibacillus keqinensis]